MPRLLTLCLILLSFASLFGQNIDSLFSKLESPLGSCEILNTCLDIVNLQPNHRSSDSILHKFHKKIYTCNNQKTSIRFMSNYLRNNVGKYSPEVLYSKYDSLILEAKKNKYTEYLLKILVNYSTTLKNSGDQKKSIDVLLRDEFSEENKHDFPKIFAFRHFNLGNIYYEESDLGESLSHFQLAESISINNKMHDFLPNIYNNLNLLFRQINDIKTAKFYLTNALNYVDTSSYNACIIYYNLGVRYRELNMLDSAKHFINKSLNTCPGLNGRNYSELSTIFHKNKEYDKALEYIYKEEVIKFQTQNEDELDNRLGKIANIEYYKGKYLLSKIKFNQAIQISTFNIDDDFDNRRKYYQGFFRSIWKLNNQDSLVEKFNNYVETIDTIIKLNIANSISQAEVKHQTEKKEKLLLEQRYKNELQKKEIAEKDLRITKESYRKKTYIIFAFLSFIGMVLYWRKSKKNKTRALLSESVVQKLEIENNLIQVELSKTKKGESEIFSLLEKPIKLFDNKNYKYKDILYFESRDDAVHYFTKDKKYHPPTYGALKDLAKRLFPPPIFVQIHRKHLVNIFNIEKFDRKSLTVNLVDGTELKIARPRKKEVLNTLEKHLNILPES